MTNTQQSLVTKAVRHHAVVDVARADEKLVVGVQLVDRVQYYQYH